MLKFKPEYATVKLSEIEVRDRYREDYGDLKGMRETFSITGQINTITVKRLPEGSVFNYRLLAGGRRYFAFLEDGVFEIGVAIYPEDISEETMLLIEQIENVQRKEMDWKELAQLQADIDSCQKGKHPEWSQDDTADVLQSSQASVSRNIKLARALKEIPELANCDSQQSALNLIKKIEAEVTREKIIASKKMKDKLSSKASRLDKHYIVKDAFEGMSTLQSGTFDLVEIDPPYGIAYKERAAASQTLHYVDVKDEDYAAFMSDLLGEAWRLGKDDSWVLLWCAYSRLNACQDALRNVGYHVPSLPITWSKVLGVAMPVSYNLASTAEVCIYARKGAPKLAKFGVGTIFTCMAPRYENRIHPTERALSMMTELLSTFLLPGAQILCPFLGSGVTIIASEELHMSCIGFDLSEEYKNGFLLKLEDWTGYKNSDIDDMKQEELSVAEGVEKE